MFLQLPQFIHIYLESYLSMCIFTQSLHHEQETTQV